MLINSPNIQAKTAASVATPPSGEVTLFLDSATGHLSQKDSTGTVTDLAAAGGGGGSPAGSGTEVQFRNGAAFGAAANVSVANGNLELSNLTASQPTPTAGRSAIYFIDRDPFFSPELDYLCYERDDGRVVDLMPDGRHVIQSNWYGISNILFSTGTAATATGTLTAATEAATNIYTQTRKVEALVTVAATTAVAGLRSNSNYFNIGGPVANVGGFYLDAIAGRATGVATASSRFFCGVAAATTAPTDAEPSSITNIFGFGCDAADANYQIMYRGAGAVTKVDLGANFPVDTTDRSELYRLQLFSPPGVTQSVKYKVTKLSNGQTATGTVTTNLPATGQFLGFRVWASAGGTSSVIGIALNRMQCLVYV